jgi:hypothetical protein
MEVATMAKKDVTERLWLDLARQALVKRLEPLCEAGRRFAHYLTADLAVALDDEARRTMADKLEANIRKGLSSKWKA